MAAVNILIAVVIVFSSPILISAHRSNCKVEEYRVQKNFDPAKFAGTWYAYKYLPNALFPEELPMKDISLSFLPNTDGNYTLYSRSRMIGQTSECNMAQGVLRVPNINTNMSAKMVLEGLINPTDIHDFWVLETDYVSYAIVYWCSGQLNETTGFCEDADVNGWGLVRQIWDPITSYQLRRIDHRLDYFCSNVSLYQMIHHSKQKCRFSSPIFWTPQPAFNLSRYMGRWYEQMFVPPTPFQRDLATLYYQHNYEMGNDGNITVRISGIDPPTQGKTCFNKTQLVTIRPTNTPGKLDYIRTRSGTPESSDYVVVLTDYVEFAFVLGCVALADDGARCEHYQSWVWTRTRQMSSHCAVWAKRLMDLYDLDDTIFYFTPHNQTCTWEPPPRPGVLLKDSNNNFLLGTCTVAFFNRACPPPPVAQNTEKCTSGASKNSVFSYLVAMVTIVITVVADNLNLK